MGRDRSSWGRGRGGAAAKTVARVLFAIFALFSNVQTHALDSARAITQYVRQTWTTQEGLPQNTVSALVQSPDGYLWFGTEEGLVRFDGASFTVYDKTNIPGLRDNAVSALCLDGAGNLWMGTWGGDLLRVKGGLFEDMTGGTGPFRGGVWSLFASVDGNLWAATSLGLFRSHGDAHSLVTTRDGLPTNDLRALCGDGFGGLWIGTRTAGVFRMQFGRAVATPELAPLAREGVWCLLMGRDGSLWIGTTGGGVCRFKAGRLTRFGVEDGLTQPSIRALWEDRDGNLWVGTNGGGLHRFSGGRFTALTTKSGLPDDFVSALTEDREGSLWVGTTGGGLVRLTDGKFLAYGLWEGLPGNVARVACEDAAGALWIGTSGYGLSRFEAGRFTTYDKKGGLSGDSVRALCAGRDGSLWVGTEAGGLDHFSGGRWNHLGAKEGLGGDFVLSILEAKDGTLWVGTYGGGLFRTSAGRFTALTTRGGLPNDEVWCLHEDRQGRLWVGTTGGLAVLDHGVLKSFFAKDGLAGEIVVSAFEGEGGDLWFGTSGGGVVRFKDGKLKACTRRDGLYDDVVFQILPDGLGNLWMSCNKGLFRVPLASLEAFADGKASTVECTAFGKSDGMRSSECMGGGQPAGCATRDGRLWFPTSGGMVAVAPRHLPSNAVPPPLVLDALLADEKPVLGSSGAVVPAGTHSLEFRYAGLSFRAPERVRFRYRLTGFDGSWVEAGNRRIAYYTNVSPGRYRFEVRACNEDGVWNESGTGVAVRVLPKFTQTLPFFAACVLLAAAVAWGSYQIRVRQLKAREKELVLQVAERTRSLREEKSKVEDALATIEVQERELQVFNRELEAKVKDQLGTILKSRRLAKYFPRRLVETILRSDEDVDLRSERRNITIFFADMAGFSTLTDKMEPERMTRVLNDYLTVMAESIERHGGTLARFMGDGILGFFGAPDAMDPALQAEAAVRMGVAMNQGVADLATRWRASGVDDQVLIRVGIHQDFVTVGNFGSADHMEYTAVGRGINLAARLESNCAPGHILVSYQIYALTSDLFPYEDLGKREFKGFARPLPVYGLDPSKVTGG